MRGTWVISGSGPRRRPAPMDPQTIPDTAARRRRGSRARRAAPRRRRERPGAAGSARPRARPCGRRSRCCRWCSPALHALRADAERPALAVAGRGRRRRARAGRGRRRLPPRRAGRLPAAPRRRLGLAADAAAAPRRRARAGARRARRRRHRGGVGRGAGRADRRARLAHRAGARWPSATSSSATTCSRALVESRLRARRRHRRRARPGVGPRRRGRRLPDDRPRADPHRAVRRRGRARVGVLVAHAAVAARPRPRRHLPGRRSCSTSTARPRFADATTARRDPARPRLAGARAAGRRRRWSPGSRGSVARAAEERLAEVADAAAPRGAATCELEDVARAGRRPARLRRAAAGPGGRVRGAAPGARRRAASPRPRTSCAAWCAAGQRVLVAFPHRGDAERTALQLQRVDTELLEPGAALPSAPGVYFVVSRLRRGLVSSQLGAGGAAVGAGLPPRAPPTRRVGRRACASVHRPAARRLRRPRGPRRRPLRRVRHQDRRGRHPRLPVLRVQGRGQAVRAARADREGVALHRRRRPRRRRSRSSAARPGTTLKARARARRARAGRRAARAVRRAPGVGAAAVRAATTSWMRAARGGVPVHGDRGPGARDRGRQGRPRVAAADGPPDLRRRRLRQDRGRDARGREGRRRRAGRC